MSAQPFGDEAWRWETGAMRRDLEVDDGGGRDPVPPSVPRRTRDTRDTARPPVVYPDGRFAQPTKPTPCALAAWLKSPSIGGVPNGVVVGGIVIAAFLGGLFVGRR